MMKINSARNAVFIGFIILFLNLAAMPAVNSNIVYSINANEAKWTVMIYMAVEDIPENGFDEEEYALEQFEDLEYYDYSSVEGKLNIVVQFDHTDLYNGNTRRYYVRHHPDSGIGSRLEKDLGEQNMGDPDTLAQFLTWARSEYPAERYCVIIKGHGYGWKEYFCYDESDKHLLEDAKLSMTELKSALESFSPNSADTIDILVLEACFMGMIEICYQLDDVASRVVAPSGGLEGEGIPYGFIRDLYREIGDGDDDYMSPDEVCTKMVTMFGNCYSNRYPIVAVNAFEIVHGLGPYINELAQDLSTAQQKWRNRAKIKEARMVAEHYNDPPEPQYPNDDPDYRSLFDIVYELQERDIPGCNVDELDSILDDVLIARIGGRRALTIYWPEKTEWKDKKNQYKDLDFAERSWDEFLSEFLKTKKLVINLEPRIYVDNVKKMSFPITIFVGDTDIEINAEDANRVEFYIDDELKETVTEKPYIWTWDEFSFGRHTIKVIAYDDAGNSDTDEMTVWKFF